MTAVPDKQSKQVLDPVLVLDFDGVICDGFMECAMVTWNGHFQRPLREFGPEGLKRIPQAFLDRFRETRGHARHLGHFLVPLVAGTSHLPDQQAFDHFFAGIPDHVITGFTADVSRYRDAARTSHSQRWLGYHRMYEGIVDVLLAAGDRWYIVTAKDADSVRAILARNGVHLAADRVYGEQTSKCEALTDIAQRESVLASDVYFFDDSLPNVIAAGREGFNARWATWGFHADDHVVTARRLGVASVNLTDFASSASVGLNNYLRDQGVEGAAG